MSASDERSSLPSPIPDDKDWTWVLDRACPACGFDASSAEPRGVATLLRDNTLRWVAVLERPDVRDRPAPAVWSPLEYGAHVRDVHRLYLERLELMLDRDGPEYPNWDQDDTAVAERYHEDDPAEVAAALETAAYALADRFDQVEDHQWSRTGYRGDGAEFTVASFARYFIHDPIHHLHDVGAAWA